MMVMYMTQDTLGFHENNNMPPITTEGQYTNIIVIPSPGTYHTEFKSWVIVSPIFVYFLTEKSLTNSMVPLPQDAVP